MNWNTGVLAGATALLAWALGGVYGLLVVTALFVFCWLMRSIRIAETASREQRAQEPDPRQREAARKAQRERQSQRRRRQTETESESETRRERQSKQSPKRSDEHEWWSVLEVPPYASADEIRHAYRCKIKQCHPDRVVGLAPELLEWAESCTRTLNAAYSEANRARRSAAAAR